MALAAALVDGFLDLVLGSACVGCGRPGRPLCPECETGLPARGSERTPTPCPAGPAPIYAAGDYAGTLRAMVIAHKERRVLALARPLGGLLAIAAAAALEQKAPVTPVVLTPVPSRGRAVRARGHDPTLAMTRHAARALREAGHVVVVGRLLRLASGVADQAGLDAEQRAENLRGSMAADGAALRGVAATVRRAHVVVCDDVVTTGATLREAQRALAAVGIAAPVGACVAATRRRRADPV